MIKFFFKTYGCQANVADSEGLMSYLRDLGCELANSEVDSDIIFVNTCAVRAKAEQKMFSYLGDLVQYKRIKPYIRIGMIGCVASYKKEDVYSRYDHISFVFGAREDIKTFHAYLLDTITSLETAKQLYLEDPLRAISSGQDRDIKKIVEDKKIIVPNIIPFKKDIVQYQEVKKAYVNIMTGCNNYCTYCIVPFTRGREKSYSLNSIVSRVQREIQSGAKEITLIGQNVNSYHDPETNQKFTDLLRAIANVDGDFWIRYISPHPKDMTRDVLAVMAEYKDKLCDWIHMPLQAGSDKVLDAMNRTYTVDRYMETIAWINEFLPNASITTDIIVGFPSETEEDFQGTMSVVNNVRYSLIYSFIYSPRKYTKAYNMEDTTDYKEKQRRLSILQKCGQELSLARNLENIGLIKRSLVEKRLTDGKLLARTAGNTRIVFDGGDNIIGKFVNVQIEKAGPVNLEGSLI